MKITPYAIEKIAPFIARNNTGREIIQLFNNYGIRDIYDQFGMPDIGKKMDSDLLKQNMSKKGWEISIKKMN